ncbi:MAG: diadenylate cyclase CdaA [Thermomicrobiales bacterium]|nr:diadenylate cyclase CdaA [Thermomicrobiales bacterium]MCO5217842.1 diadenylate cyclase CdaA [Thermomicrobiales bacterium]MCO5223901.1 diadenylate cyclase CdaA [Thermomicrobiales bacterium]MCO5227464.1 diadenylate cyclase CdaA [Thermomicrobiales bacterium]
MLNFSWVVERLFDPRAIVDILVVTALFYWVLWVAQGTRALSVIRGIIFLFLILFITGEVLQLRTLNAILSAVWPALVIAIPVIFQPELRRAFEQLGHAGSWIRSPFPSQDDTAIESMIEEVVRASYQLSRLRYGALIVIERETTLQDFVARGVAINADISRQLLINIFFPNSPLHDAAVVIGSNRILAASVVLPLTDNISASSSLGTRHRAGVGITEESDAIAVIVSEETGQMSVAHSGRLIRNLDQDRLRRVLRTLLRIEATGTNTQQGGGPIGRIRRLFGADQIAQSSPRTRRETTPSP